MPMAFLNVSGCGKKAMNPNSFLRLTASALPMNGGVLMARVYITVPIPKVPKDPALASPATTWRPAEAA